MPLDVDLVELSRDGRDEVLLHLDRHVLRQHREQEPLLEEEEKATVRPKVANTNTGRAIGRWPKLLPFSTVTRGEFSRWPAASKHLKLSVKQISLLKISQHNR